MKAYLGLEHLLEGACFDGLERLVAAAEVSAAYEDVGHGLLAGHV